MHLVRLLSSLPRQIWIHVMEKRVTTWFEDGFLAACAYPRDERALEELAKNGVTMLVNLHQRPHAPEALIRHGMTQVHMPVPDFTSPTPEQLDQGVRAIEQAKADGRKVAVHCGAGLGRTGTLLACYLVKTGLTADGALKRIRAARPGSVETPQQEAAIHMYAQRIGRE